MSNLCTKVSNDGETMRRRGERDRADAESKPQQKTEKKTMRRGMAGRKPIGESPPPPRANNSTGRTAKERKKRSKTIVLPLLACFQSSTEIPPLPATTGSVVHEYRTGQFPTSLSFFLQHGRSTVRINRTKPLYISREHHRDRQRFEDAFSFECIEAYRERTKKKEKCHGVEG